MTIAAVLSVKELASLSLTTIKLATVTEWLGENSQHYQSFQTHDQLCDKHRDFFKTENTEYLPFQLIPMLYLLLRMDLGTTML